MKNYHFVFPYRVRVADVNYGGHVANSAVLDFFQEARVAFLGSLGPYSELDIGGGCGMILTEAQVKYLAEMFHGDELIIGIRIIDLRRSFFVLEYRIERNGEPTAEGTTALVCFDYGKRKPARLDEGFREKLENLERRF